MHGRTWALLAGIHRSQLLAYIVEGGSCTKTNEMPHNKLYVPLHVQVDHAILVVIIIYP